MTALTKYQRLECPGLWRASPEDQRREVEVRFGEATLILIDPKSGSALSHWSLPAVERLNPGEDPPLFTPGTDALESLELTDPDMIDALQTVRRRSRRQPPAPDACGARFLAGPWSRFSGSRPCGCPGRWSNTPPRSCPLRSAPRSASARLTILPA
jgi:hypothetical protein